MMGYNGLGNPLYEIIPFKPSLVRGQTTVGKKQFKYITGIVVRP